MPATRQSFHPDEALMEFQAYVLGKTGVWLTRQKARVLRLLLGPKGATNTLIDMEEWPEDEGDANTFARIRVIVSELRKLLSDHVDIKTFHGSGYRARWKDATPTTVTERTYEKAHYCRAS